MFMYNFVTCGPIWKHLVLFERSFLIGGSILISSKYFDGLWKRIKQPLKIEMHSKIEMFWLIFLLKEQASHKMFYWWWWQSLIMDSNDRQENSRLNCGMYSVWGDLFCLCEQLLHDVLPVWRNMNMLLFFNAFLKLVQLFFCIW